MCFNSNVNYGRKDRNVLSVVWKTLHNFLKTEKSNRPMILKYLKIGFFLIALLLDRIHLVWF